MAECRLCLSTLSSVAPSLLKRREKERERNQATITGTTGPTRTLQAEGAFFFFSLPIIADTCVCVATEEKRRLKMQEKKKKKRERGCAELRRASKSPEQKSAYSVEIPMQHAVKKTRHKHERDRLLLTVCHCRYAPQTVPE